MAVVLTTTETTQGESAKSMTLPATKVLKVLLDDVEQTELTVTAPEGKDLSVYVSVRAVSVPAS